MKIVRKWLILKRNLLFTAWIDGDRMGPVVDRWCSDEPLRGRWRQNDATINEIKIEVLEETE